METIKRGQLILGENQYYSMNDRETKLNNNVLVVGSSGSGKTRSIVEPNLLQANGSYIVLDPKGNLHRKYMRYFLERGYAVQTLNFLHPEQSSKYNFFDYIKGTQDIIKMSHLLVHGMTEDSSRVSDQFWNESAELLLSSIISYLYEYSPKSEQTLENVFKLVASCNVVEDAGESKTILDLLMEDIPKEERSGFTYKQYFKFRCAASRTLKSILISLNARAGRYDTPEINRMLSRDELKLASFGQRKKILFVIVSDTDRSMDGLVNVFFTQAMDELCRYADEKCADYRLPVDVRFILDDFGTNCKILNFPKMISNIRSRGISAMIMLQAEAQLVSAYGEDAGTIIANCDSYIYLGGNDITTAQNVAQRCNLPYYRVLNMAVGRNWIFRRGQEPVNGYNFPLEQYEKIRKQGKATELREI